MSEDKSSTQVPHFDGIHYNHWGELIDIFLKLKGL